MTQANVNVNVKQNIPEKVLLGMMINMNGWIFKTGLILQ